MPCYEEQGGCLGDLDRAPKAQLTGCEKESLGKFLVVWADIFEVGTGLLEVVGVYEKPTGWEGGYHLCAWGC
jgi:hypothetical protein